MMKGDSPLNLPPMAALTEREAMLLSPLRLAYVGDAVHELLVRTALLGSGGKARAMHREAVAAVRAGAQADALERLAPLLTEAEADIVRRGRNAHPHHAAPKAAGPAAYARATALEALLGYLYLTGQAERLSEIYRAMQSQER
jgi:ribonuclease-3 family protein